MDRPQLSAIEELNTFCNKFSYRMELEVPFEEMEGFVLCITNSNKDIVMSKPFVGIDNMPEACSSLLGKLAKEH
jgi:hypothetical protein